MPEFNFKLQPSKRLIFLIIVLSLTSSFNFLFVSTPFGINYLCLALTLIYGWMIFKRFGLLKHSKSVIAMRRNKDNQWVLQTKQQLYPAEILGDSLLTSVLLLLRFKSSHFYFASNVLIVKDSLENEDDFRELAKIIKCDQRGGVFHPDR